MNNLVLRYFALVVLIWVAQNSNCYAQAPVISYKTPVTFIINTPAPALLPINSGGSVDTYSISPALPTPMTFNTSTGAITGTPTTVSGSITYTITATNKTASVPFSVIISFNPPAPYISYSPLSNTFKVGTIIAPLTPVNTGGAVDKYTVSPALPAGLILNPATGSISGTPTAVSTLANYTVTATNVTGNADFNLQITVNQAEPNISYKTTVNKFIVGVSNYDDDADVSQKEKNATAYLYRRLNSPAPILKPKLTPATGKDPISYSVSPKLPPGLSLNSTTGTIVGTPTTVSADTLYKVTATYANSPQSSFNINISVVANPDIVTSPPTIQFVGQGNIQQSLNSGAAIAANTGIGVIYRQNSSRRYGILHNIEVDFSINVASTVDTIKSVNNSQNVVTNRQDFGNSVLLPSNSGQAFSFNFKGYFTQKGGKNGDYMRNAAPLSLGGVLSGFNISLNGSNRNWQYNAYNDPSNTGASPSPVLVKTSLLSLYIGPFFEFVTPTKDNNYGENASITLGLGYSGRWILGDAQQGAQADFRSELLGSTQNSFNGAELTLALRFYNIKAEVHLPFLSNKANIPGLSGTHLTTFIGFSGGFPIDLTKPAGQ